MTPSSAPRSGAAGADLDALQRALDAMTPGPWHVDDPWVRGPDNGALLHIPAPEPDAAGIVALRNAARDLLRELTEGRAREERLRTALREMALAYHVFNGACTTDLPSCEQPLCVYARAALEPLP